MCRYDAKTKKNENVIKYLEKNGYEIVPFCPEAPLFGTPRERIDVIKSDDGFCIMTHNSNKDVTQPLQEYIEDFIQNNQDADMIILKSRSPSCGLGTTPILDKNKNVIAYGNGIAADIFLKYFPKSNIFDEYR